MATARVFPSNPLLLLPLFTLIVNCIGNLNEATDHKVYIVYMGDRPKGDFFSTTALHRSFLQAALGSERAAVSWIYSYTRSFNGFVASLTEDEMKKIAGLRGVVSVFPNTKKHLHTTRSWDFMGFPLSVPRSQTESDVIIGTLDTGVWPESRSFNDTGYGPPPSKWKGSCQSSSNFTCNNKIVGAKYYRSDAIITPPENPSPRDFIGHGTHTASIAAGAIVSGANFYGLGLGTARGGVPSARIAVYKVCWWDGCYSSDILAAFDDAIADGVDIISISIGTDGLTNYAKDPIAIGAFHAMKNGILTSTSAGNSGPGFKTLSNYSPWSLTVAASTIDRKFVDKVRLGNGKTYDGVAVNTFTPKQDSYPLVCAGNVPNKAGGFDGSQSMYCQLNSLDPELVNGAIILCNKEVSPFAGAGVDAGASGVIFYTNEFSDIAQAFPIPVSQLGEADGDQVYDYINKTSNPTATIFKSSEAKESSSPFVATFSSRGPNPMGDDILKPDLTAPGVDILAAWSETPTVTGYPQDTRVVAYNIISGTSMSCPHASAAAAYVKSFNPTWSPAAIKSALMTTATEMKTNTNYSGFAYGSGHINPVRAKSPGLVYDMGEGDYVSYLCSQGYSNESIQLITGDGAACIAGGNQFTAHDLNYPSFSVSGANGSSVSAMFQRTVTNVGSPSSTYKAAVAGPPRLSIQVQPSTLSFVSVGEKQTFVVSVNASGVEYDVLSGSLVWDDGMHQVRSPVVAYCLPDDGDDD